MPKGNFPVTSFNHGLVSKLALARVDLARLKFAAEMQTNWFPRVLGPMMLRPGLQFVAQTAGLVEFIPFVFSHEDTALIEIAVDAVRVRIDEAYLTRIAVSTTVVDSNFTTNSGAWILTNAEISGGFLRLENQVIGETALAYQRVAIAVGDRNVENGLTILVNLGPVDFRIGSQLGLDDLFATKALGRGSHSVAFTPTGDFVYLQFEVTSRRDALVFLCQTASAGPVGFGHQYDPSEFSLIRYTQSGDIIFVAVEGHQQMMLQRQTARSWSFVYYEPEDGPFLPAPSRDIKLTPSGIANFITITASSPFFVAGHTRSLLRMFQEGQLVQELIAGQDEWSEPIRVSGVSAIASPSPGGDPAGIFVGAAPGGSRTFEVVVSTADAGPLTLQRSFDAPDFGFADVRQYFAPTDEVLTDEFDNSVAWYRIGFKQGDYRAGEASIALIYPGGGGAGIVRIVDVLGSGTCLAEVIKPLHSKSPTRDWQEQKWSDKYGWPSCTTLYDGRLWWAGKDSIDGSVSDAYGSFDAELIGDAGPISRSLGFGPVDRINWLLPLQRLLLGMELSEASVRSTTFDQPLTPTAFSIKAISTQGSAQLPAVQLDTRGIFIHRTKRRIFSVHYEVAQQDYTTTDLTTLLPDLDSNFVKIAVQRQPDSRIHCLRADGTVLVLLHNPEEEVTCWYTVEAGGNYISGIAQIVNVVVLPGDTEDIVYYLVKRTISGQILYYLERYALTEQCVGSAINRQMDSHIIYAQTPATDTISVPHLDGETVVVWAGGKDLGIFTVSGGVVTLPLAVSEACVGLFYLARFKSAKLAYAAGMGTALNQKKRLINLGLILMNTHAQGMSMGQSFDRMDGLPLMSEGAPVNPDAVYDEFDGPAIEVPGTWDTDARLCLQAGSPRPVTVLGAVLGMVTNDKG